jgi:protein SCO1/2
MTLLVATILALGLALEPAPDIVALPDFALENFDGRPITNAVFEGRTTVVVPPYAKCVFACPIVTLLLTQLDAELGAPDHVQYLHVSIQPEEDTVDEILSHFENHEIDASRDRRWFFANGPPTEIQRLLAATGIEITRTPVEGGLFIEHTIRVFVVGPDGAIGATFDSYFWDEEEMRHALQAPPNGV